MAELDFQILCNEVRENFTDLFAEELPGNAVLDNNFHLIEGLWANATRAVENVNYVLFAEYPVNIANYIYDPQFNAEQIQQMANTGVVVIDLIPFVIRYDRNARRKELYFQYVNLCANFFDVRLGEFCVGKRRYFVPYSTQFPAILRCTNPHIVAIRRELRTWRDFPTVNLPNPEVDLFTRAQVFMDEIIPVWG